MTSPKRYVTKASKFISSYTEGLDSKSFRRLFGEEATDAYKVLSRDHQEREPKDDLSRFLFRARVLFVAISDKLSPPRRTLFALSVLATLVGAFWPTELNLNFSGPSLSLDFSPLWFLAAIGGFAYLLIFELVDRIRYRDELEVARQLQRDLMPQIAPEIPGYSFAHSYQTATAVGGDYYDFQSLADGRLALVIGDASGHGIGAGLLMAIANSTLKTALDIDPEPQSVAKLMNRSLFRSGDRRAFMTLLYGVMDPETGAIEMVCAGHPFPLIRRSTGEVEEYGTGSLPLGLREQLDVPAQTLHLGPGDTLLLFTDGLAEGMGESTGESFGFGQIRDLLREPAPPTQLHDRIVSAFQKHHGSGNLEDDVTLLLIARDSLPLATASVPVPSQPPKLGSTQLAPPTPSATEDAPN